jgi:hypothetical protein
MFARQQVFSDGWARPPTPFGGVAPGLRPPPFVHCDQTCQSGFRHYEPEGRDTELRPIMEKAHLAMDPLMTKSGMMAGTD